jgi:hypothetical protein
MRNPKVEEYQHSESVEGNDPVIKEEYCLSENVKECDVRPERAMPNVQALQIDKSAIHDLREHVEPDIKDNLSITIPMDLSQNGKAIIPVAAACPNSSDSRTAALSIQVPLQQRTPQAVSSITPRAGATKTIHKSNQKWLRKEVQDIIRQCC